MNVPLIRSAALAPITRWMQDQGLDPYPLLKQSGLGWFEDQNPLEPISLRFAALLLRNLARQEGPDTPWRIVQDRGFFELGLLSSLVLKAATPRGVFALVEMAIATHCTHEIYKVSTSERNDLVVEGGWALSFDDETLHFVQQYNTAMVSFICNLTSEPPPLKCSTVIVRKRRTIDGHQETQARRDCR